MEPEEVFKEKPIYRWEDVVTQDDLRMALASLLAIYDMQPKGRDKDHIGVAVNTVDAMLQWVLDGKPDNFALGDK